MREDKWLDTKAMVKTKFTVLKEGKGPIEDIPHSSREFLEFEGPQGMMRLEYIVRPAVIDKKTTYSKTGGRAGQVDYIYSEDEFVHKMQAFKWNDDLQEWEEIKAPLPGV